MNFLKYVPLFLFIALIGCNTNSENPFRPKGEGEMENGQKNGPWKYFDSNGNLLKSGRYCNGLLCGEWNYKIGIDSVSIDWLNYADNENGIELSFPLPYLSQNNDKTIFFALDSTNKREYLTILEHNEPEITGDVHTYYDILIAQLIADSLDRKLNYINFRKIGIDGEIPLYTGHYVTILNKIPRVVYVDLFVFEDRILEIGGFFLKENEKVKKRLYDEFTKNIRFDGEAILSFDRKREIIGVDEWDFRK